jgi:LPXTG-motif cell wall-anchored protein
LLAVYGGLATLLVTSMNQVIPELTVVGAGVGIWILSAAWGIAADRGYLAPQRIGLAAGAVGFLVGAIMTMENPAGQALALLTVAALLAAGIATTRVMFIGIGAAGTLWVIPKTANRYLPGSVAAPLAVAIVGLVLLGIALWLARRRKRAS